MERPNWVTRNRKVLTHLFYLYMAFLIVVVIFKFTGSWQVLWDRMERVRTNRELGYWNYNLTLGATLRIYLSHRKEGFAMWNMIGNLIPFVPMGFLIPLCYPKLSGYLRVILTAFIIVLIAEVLQFVTLLGSFDVDDIIMNLLSVTLGYPIYLMLNRLR